MSEPDQQQEAFADAPGDSLANAHLGARDDLQKYAQLYSTVTDLARLRGWSTFDPRFTAM
jgi:hypothetical protein